MKEIKKKYRTEWKYFDDIYIMSQIKESVSAVLDKDSHAGPSGKYEINSLYFDDIDDSCARENVNGEGKRFKYRIRYYGNDVSHVFLERKEKNNSFCHKNSCKVSSKEVECLIKGDVEQVLWETENKLLQQFCKDIMVKGFAPKVIVCYEREAYVEPISNVRITFDSNIYASDDVDGFLDYSFRKIPVIEGRKSVLEVKFDYVLPSYIRNVIQAHVVNQQAFSKYYMSRLCIQSINISN